MSETPLSVQVLNLVLQQPGITDSEITSAVGKGLLHQQINQVCHKLKNRGKLTRSERPDDGLIGNYPCDIHLTVEGPSIENRNQVAVANAAERNDKNLDREQKRNHQTTLDFRKGIETLNTVIKAVSEGSCAINQPPEDSFSNATMFVQCVSGKIGENENRTYKARDIYNSTWFKKARRYAEKSNYEWYILSAKHGLLHPDEEISWYNDTLKEKSSNERKIWAAKVLVQIKNRLAGRKRFIFIAGVKYRKALAALLLQRGDKIEVPMEGLAIGKQMNWLDNH